MEYYKAYDQRYRQVHALGLDWASHQPTPLLGEILSRYGIGKDRRILEIGCGEGRDAVPLLREGYDLLAADVSPEAIRRCRERWPERAASFRVLDVCADEPEERFAFIFAVAVLHMLTEDRDRDAFYAFLRRSLRPGGCALVLSMGDGEQEFCSDASRAFEAVERVHQASGRRLRIASTSCRVVSRETLRAEAERNGLLVAEEGQTSIPGEFDSMLYLVLKTETR
ncbi:MAG: class I SAM-dependent methyltransferase [Oscillospiraceae bacterium]|nr:class I SAM-dependent methyltransferase [Oscillospiraceae bacterium]